MEQVRASYDRVAAVYTEHIAGELAHKPLDRALLGCLVELVGARGPICDVGCGPGQVAGFLHEQGAEVLGVDLSPAMVAQARARFPTIPFEEGNMLALALANDTLGGIAAFYAIVHLSLDDTLPRALREFARVLQPGGRLLLAFHIGDEPIHRDELWEVPVSLDFQLFQPAAVAAALVEAGFTLEATTERTPYPEVEAPTRRAYLLARKPGREA